ncbi:MAG: hypothetical protein GX079_07150 [Tissierellia bacterium]|nr:hypothetical protein [Tissierellia bacterium]
MNYDRNRPVISEKDQALLGEKTVAILGLGGLGGYLASGALRLGVRKLILIDYDTFDETNLNRQLFSNEENLGRLKVEVAKEELLKIDPQAEIIVYNKRVQAIGDLVLFKGTDLIFDGLDSVVSRLLLMEIAMELGIPLVHGAISSFEGQLAFLDPDKNRMELIYPRKDLGASKTNFSFLPSFIASLQINKMLKYFLFEEDLERNVLFRFDLRNRDFYKIQL